MSILVIGAGPAGTRCAELLAQRMPGHTVILAGEEPGMPYDRVALGQYLSGTVEPEALVTHRPQDLMARGIQHRPGLRIAWIDRAARQVVGTAGEIFAYEALVLATGARAVRPTLPGSDLRGVFVYRTMADVTGMLARAVSGMPAIVVGGGLLGIEAAASLRARGMDVTVMHSRRWLMDRQLDEGAGGYLKKSLQQQGIMCVMPASVAAVEGEDEAVGVRLADGRFFPAGLVVFTVGVRPNTALAREADLPVRQGILVDDAMRTADPAIYAIGDCAEHAGMVCGLVAPALAQAAIAAGEIAGEPSRYTPKPDAAKLKVPGIHLWSAGEIGPPDAEVITLEDAGNAEYRRLWVRQGRLVGAVLFGDVDDSGFYGELIASGRSIENFRDSLALGPEFSKEAA